MTTLLIDTMHEAWENARRANRKPRRWEVNGAAKARLLAEDSVWRMTEHRRELTEFLPPIFGVPVARMEDCSEDPKWNLIVDERKRTIDYTVELDADPRSAIILDHRKSRISD